MAEECMCRMFWQIKSAHLWNISKDLISLNLLSRHHSVGIYGDIKEHDGAVERPLRCKLLQDHSDPQELSWAAGLRPVQRKHGDGLGELAVTKHSVHHAAGGHGQCAQCAEQRRDGGDNRSGATVNEHREAGEGWRVRVTPLSITFTLMIEERLIWNPLQCLKITEFENI